MARGKDTSKHPNRKVDRLTFVMPTHGVVLNSQQDDERPAPPIHKVGDRVVDFRGEMRGVVEKIIESPYVGKSHRTQVRLDSGELSHPYYESVWEPEK